MSGIDKIRKEDSKLTTLKIQAIILNLYYISIGTYYVFGLIKFIIL